MKKALQVLFFILSVLCTVYFVIIVGYGGTGTAYSYMWILFALFFAAMGVFSGRSFLDKSGLPGFIPVFVYTSFGLGCAIFMSTLTMVIGTAYTAEATGIDYCIVIGARVYPNGISRTLKLRLDKALEISRDNPDAVLVLAGGQSPADAVPEAFAMYNYLSMKGVHHDRMIINAHRNSTDGILESSAGIIGEHAAVRRTPKGPGDKVWGREYIPRTGIITSDYHLYRTMRIAEKFPIGSPVAIPAPSDDILFVHYCVKESLAIIKDFFAGNLSEYGADVPFDRIQRDQGIKGNGISL